MPRTASRSRRRSSRRIRRRRSTATARSKLAVERALPHFETRSRHCAGLRLRYFNASGADPDGEIGEDHSPEIHLIPRAIEAATGGRGLQVFGDDYPTPDGTCLRDYIHVSDLADAHVKALEVIVGRRALGRHTISERAQPHSVREVIDTVERVTGRRVPWTLGAAAPRRSGGPLRGAATRRRRNCDWTAAIRRPGDHRSRPPGTGTSAHPHGYADKSGGLTCRTAAIHPQAIARLFSDRIAGVWPGPSSAWLSMPIGSAGLAYLIKPIFDERAADTAARLGVRRLGDCRPCTSSKSIGWSNVSSSVIAGQLRSARRDRRAEHAVPTGPSSDNPAGFFAHGATSGLLSRHQRRHRADAAAVSDDRGNMAHRVTARAPSATPRSCAIFDAQLTGMQLTGAAAHGAPLAVRAGPARAAHDEAETRKKRSRRCRTSAPKLVAGHPHREGGRGRKFHEAACKLDPRRLSACFRTNMKVAASLCSLPALHGVNRSRNRHGGGAVRPGHGGIASSQLTPGRFHTVHQDTVPDVPGPPRELSRVNADLQQAIPATKRIFGFWTRDGRIKAPNAPASTPFRHEDQVPDVVRL